MSAAAAMPQVHAFAMAGRVAEEDVCLSMEVARDFYRGYTERLLGRYVRTALEMGRSPSILGNLIFRGKASHTGVRNFEDAIIFVHDVEKCLQKLGRREQELVARIALQEYTQQEVACMLGMSARSVMRRYAEAIDRLTAILLDVEMLEALQ